MSRMLLVLAVAAVIATMVVTAGPAMAGISVGGGGSIGGGSIGGISFGGSSDIGDDDTDGFNNDVTFISVGSSLDDFDPGGITVTTG
jgi:hypothetical protein